ncbi:hypothetical protein BBJ28_00011430 [Nothophytophthora sp. Chile5]|nr:hypothetical protein BBJ28_00011430 [Nothophytophthora sp. Chile5]
MEAKFVPVFTLADLEASKVRRAEYLRYVDVDHFEWIRDFFESHDAAIAHAIDEQQKECVELIGLWVREVFRPAVQSALVQHMQEDAGCKWELVELLMVAAALTKYGERELNACKETKDGSQRAFNEGPATLYEEAQESSDYTSDDAETQSTSSVYQDGDEDAFGLIQEQELHQNYMRRGNGQHLQDQIQALNERFEDFVLRDDQQHYFDELHELNERFDDFMLSIDNHESSPARQRPRAGVKEAVQTQHLRVNGLPDRRFRENKAALAPAPAPAPTKVKCEPRVRSATPSVHVKKDGTPNGRFKANKATMAARTEASARSSSTQAKPKGRKGSGNNGAGNGGRTLLTGARGGMYYVNGNGNKVYVKK